MPRVVSDNDCTRNPPSPHELAGLDENLLAVGRDAVVAGEALEILVEHDRLRQQFLDPRADVLTHPNRLGDDDARHREQRTDDEHQADEQREAGGERAAAPQHDHETPVERIPETGEDRREQDGQEEVADEQQEAGRDGHDEEEQEALAKAIVGHDVCVRCDVASPRSRGRGALA